MTLHFQKFLFHLQKLCPVYIMGRNPSGFSKACGFLMLASVSVHVHVCVCTCVRVCEREREREKAQERKKLLFFLREAA